MAHSQRCLSDYECMSESDHLLSATSASRIRVYVCIGCVCARAYVRGVCARVWVYRILVRFELTSFYLAK